jgi:hypothetical protein
MRENTLTDSACRPGGFRRWVAIGTLAVASLAATASPAGAVTIGQVAPTTPTTNCTTPTDRIQPTVTSGTSYVVPGTGGIVSWRLTSWSTNAGAGANVQLKMKVFRNVTGTTYSVVGHDGPRTLAPSTLNTFPANLQVKSGDVLGLNSFSGDPNNACAFPLTGETYLRTPAASDFADGASGDFSTSVANNRLNISAEISPTNAFTLGAVTRNKKKGTATVAVTVPNPGALSVSGNGVKPAAITVGSAGTASVGIRASGKKKRKLKETGKVKVTPKITYTPSGGSATSSSLTVKLKKKL